MKIRDWPGLGVSLSLHAAVGVALALVHFQIQAKDRSLAVESLFETDRPAEDFTHELSPEIEVSDSLSIVSSGSAAGGVGVGGGAGGGSAAPAVSQAKIDAAGTLQGPVVSVSVGDFALPGTDQLGQDLGEGQVFGEPTAIAEGYGAAMSRITQELLRLLREEKLLVVWLFDESESMKDDQQQIREQFHKVYEELGLAVERDVKSKRDKEALLTAVHSFGESVRAILKPTSDIGEIRAAIDKIDVDPSGKENLMGAMNKVLDQYRGLVGKGRRKLVVVVVTDESGDDGQGPLLDEVIFKAQRTRAPVYILGRESMFGYPYARMRWKDPKYGLIHYLQINRGPETAAPETLQFDGLHVRWDAQNSGCAPYEQARLARETGGIFFVLPHEEAELHAQDELDRRKIAALDLKEYSPELIKRKQYEEQRTGSKFRSAIWDVVRLLNPHTDPELHIAHPWYFPTDAARFKEHGQASFQRGVRGLTMLNQAAQLLDKVKPLRDKEDSQRWRANFDLVYAQVLGYRVRLFQYLLALDAYLNDLPRPQAAQHNAWVIHRTRDMLTPNDRQIKLTKVDMNEIRTQLELAKSQFEFVRRTHPGTPWAARAEFELNQGFGMRWESTFRDPRYDTIGTPGSDIQFPTL